MDSKDQTSEISGKSNQTDSTSAPIKGKLLRSEEALPLHLPLIPLFGRPIFPGIMAPVLVESSPKMEALLGKQDFEKVIPIGLLYVESSLVDKETGNQEPDFPKVGTAAHILKGARLPDGHFNILIKTLKRFTLQKIVQREPYNVGAVSYEEPQVLAMDDEIKALSLALAGALKNISMSSPVFPDELKGLIQNLTLSEPAKLADLAAFVTSASGRELQDLLETFDLKARMHKCLVLLKRESEYLELKEKISRQIEEKLNKRQREFFLREQLKAIKEELGLEKDEKSAEIERLRKLVAQKKLSSEAQRKVEEELNKLSLLEPHSPEFGVCRNYLDWLTALPWQHMTVDQLDLQAAKKKLDEDHYGLKDVKDRILEFLSVGQLRQRVEGAIICFVGPPGVGKTSLGQSVARVLGRKFYRFSVGGIRDEAEIKGHRRTYIGAMPGKLIQALKATGTDNPVLMIDEIDKLGHDYRGDPASALLEVLDPEQNQAFVDHYLEVPYDLSKVLFIATANVLDTIPAPLLDRMEVIRLSGYLQSEKVEIAKRHLLPKHLPAHGLQPSQLVITRPALAKIIEGFAREAGVRSLERHLKKIMRRVARELVEGKKRSKVKITQSSLTHYLGQPYFREESMALWKPGVVTGLAWTALGGSVLFVESIAKPGEGFQQTGQLGAVMVESANIAYSYVMSNTAKYGLDPEFFTKQAIHLHVPAGATPKDGPSAGITMVTSLISLARGKRMSRKIAMTGEMTLCGRVLPVGGIKEKLLAAKRAGIKTVILPQDNERDYNELPLSLRQGFQPKFVSLYDGVYQAVWGDKL